MLYLECGVISLLYEKVYEGVIVSKMIKGKSNYKIIQFGKE